ncbi:hypothetical protein EGJ03_07135 [Stenotrophomonas maltophilia]|nr:hypothetical protein [Stenotrophomonas maltophilia]MBA0515850.1 hypothetical protein [Stenotrophomonas maltophilia]MBA0527994.1 hypothetical protein [Stenotrophomonas maltophilia]MBA0536698.1 hypothetical protein [Stenotrophomonas maltophilia]RRU03788.1 hypothetical protein EGJ06_19345 [Stenotrophomonas maltophilia]
MDAAAKPPGTGLRRPPRPDPSRHPTGNQLLTLLWLRRLPLRVPGATRPTPPTRTISGCL